MAIWKDQNQSPPKNVVPPVHEAAPHRPPVADPRPDLPAADLSRRPQQGGSSDKESFIAANLVIDGKIEGAGHIRIAGRFKGDVHVDGNLTIEAGAKLTGGVRAHTVGIGGEREGNIEGASRVELLETGVLNGDLKASSLTVSAGSRMRGQVEFGWEEKSLQKSRVPAEAGSAA